MASFGAGPTQKENLMRAINIRGVHDVAVVEVPDPKVSDPKNAIVKVTKSALCGVDIYPYEGHVDNWDPTTVPGHEFVGVVTEVGSAVTHIKPGDRVMCSSK